MQYEIDQSGKVENTEKDTIVAIANGEKKAVRIPAKTKRQIQHLMRQNGFGSHFVLVVFSYLLSIIFTEIKPSNQRVVIDIEYPGHSDKISNLILYFLKKRNCNVYFEFGLIGKKSSAHFHAAKVAKKRIKPDRNIVYEEINKVLLIWMKQKKSRDA